MLIFNVQLFGQVSIGSKGLKGGKNGAFGKDSTLVSRKIVRDTSALTKGAAVSASQMVSDTTVESTGRRRIEVHQLPVSPNAITDKIHYTAADSIAIDLNSRKANLYKEGNIEYQSMQLKADAIGVDFENQALHATGVMQVPPADSTGKSEGKPKYMGRPYFKQGESEYYADTISFNYNTQKGIIHGVITQEGDGFLHGTKVKKVNDSIMFLNSGQYTTCNYEHPHFALNFTHSKLIMNDKIVTGPAYLTIQDIPTPLVLPFAFFPITKEVSSGFLMPSYGWMAGRGYYLRDGGWYFSLGDYMDLSLLGEIYTNLSWAGEVRSSYYRRYKYRGSVDLRYGRTHEGLKGDERTYRSYSDFKLSWKHQQDPKANPNSRFSADVNLVSQNYNKNTTNSNDYFNSTTTSSISYSATLGSLFNLSLAANESFNAKTGIMNIKLPSVSLSSNTIYPLRRKHPSGSYRWYENISLNYTLDAQNNLSAADTDIFKRSILNQMQYGVQHSVPLQSSIKVLKFFNLTNSLSYNERWHWNTIRKDIDSTGTMYIDTVRGFRANRDLSFNSQLSTRLYGMFNFKYGPVRALRHVINPSIGFNFRPDFGSDKFGYWQQYTDTTGYVHRYSIFEQSLYGGPADGRSGRLQFSVGNNLEMKVRKRNKDKDKAASEEELDEEKKEEFTKVTLIESLNFSGNYDFAKDSLNLSDLSVNGRTTLFKNLVLNYSGTFTPYVVDTLGRKHHQYLWDVPPMEGQPDRLLPKFLQRTNSTWSAQVSYSLNNNTFNKDKGKTPSKGHPTHTQQTPFNSNPYALMGSFVDFSMPWNVSLSYTLSYVSTYVAKQYNFENNVVQNISLSGNFSLTDKWKFAVSTGYDFANKGWSYTSVDIHRDLHCWEMSFNWVPFGYYKSWNFQINIKADSLRDVKYKKNMPYQSNHNQR